MIIITNLEVTKNGENIRLAAHVDTIKDSDGNAIFNNVKIDKVYVFTEETFKESFTKSSLSTYTPVLNNLDSTSIDVLLSCHNMKDITNFTDHLLFVCITTTGTPSKIPPCGLDNEVEVGVTMYMGNVYNNFMGYIKELNSTCQVPQGMIDQFLRFKAMNTAFDAGHYTQGIEYYKNWFSKNSNKSISTYGCGCNK